MVTKEEVERAKAAAVAAYDAAVAAYDAADAAYDADTVEAADAAFDKYRKLKEAFENGN